MNLYTIGSTKKLAGEFFELLIINKIKTIIDIRLRNSSSLSGFAKKEHLEYFLKKIAGIKYIHKSEYAPSDYLLDDWIKKRISWNEYKKRYIELLKKRNIIENININIFNDACLLCSESIPEHCHRRLLAEYLSKNFKKINIIHLLN